MCCFLKKSRQSLKLVMGHSPMVLSGVGGGGGGGFDVIPFNKIPLNFKSQCHFHYATTKVDQSYKLFIFSHECLFLLSMYFSVWLALEINTRMLIFIKN